MTTAGFFNDLPAGAPDGNARPRLPPVGYQSVRTERWSFIHYVDLAGMDELYDLRADPYQMKNLIADPRSQPALRHVREELARLLRESR